MSIDEAIKHCEEVAERYEREECLQCTADHRQLAEWLTELKELRSIIDACNILAVDAFAVEKLCKGLKEAKRLLKVAVEDIHEFLCDKKNLDGDRKSCNICSYVEWCPCCRECTIRKDLRNWRYADEALKLIGENDNE